jgi:TPR repeat protein
MNGATAAVQRLNRFLAAAHWSTRSIILGGFALFVAAWIGVFAGAFSPRPGVAAVPPAKMAWTLYNPMAELRARALRFDPDGTDRPGLAYLMGDGVARDYGQALHYLTAGAALGHLVAQRALGLMYQYGLGTPENFQEARRLFSACQPLDFGCSTALAGLYYDGLGVKRDYVEARRLLSIAAAGGDPKAQSLLGFMAANGEGGKADPLEAFRWTKSAAVHGVPDAMNNLGQYYAIGVGVRRNRFKAHAWLLAAAEVGQSQAMYHLASLERRRNPTRADDIESYKWFALALRRYPLIPASRSEAERQLAIASARLSDDERAQVDAELKTWKPMPPAVLPETDGGIPN